MVEHGFVKVERGIVTRKGRYYVRFEKAGKTITEVTDATTVTPARKERAKRIGQVAEHRHVSKREQRVTVGVLLDGLLESWTKRKVASLASASCQLEAVREEFGDMPARDLKKGRMQDYIDAGATPAERSTRSGRIAILKAAMRRALDNEIIDRLPAFPKRIRNKRKGHMNPEEFEDQMTRFEGVDVDAYRMLYTSGQRLRRILDLRDTDVDTLRWVVVEQDPNGNKQRPEIRLRGELRRIIERRLRAVAAPGGHLFHYDGHPISGGALSQRWKRAMRDQGLKWMVHDFRRSAYANLLNAGVDTLVAERIIGHKTQSMASDYIQTDAIAGAMDAAIDARDRYVAKRLAATGFAVPVKNSVHEEVNQ
ncbi:MAG TPA: tyrosine-type recombinase/integrase [Thermoanaerobaculia bacterium]|nr:tyrosine-type recombinase/integrase [Thermoanaerobaculia bacterium]